MSVGSKFGKRIFLIGSILLGIGVIGFSLIFNYAIQVKSVNESNISVELIRIFFWPVVLSIIIGLILLPIGYRKWPKSERTPLENKILKMVGWGIFFIIIGTVVFFIAFYSIECVQIKAEYETNLELAREKYGFESFEIWLKEGATGKFKENCVPDIDLSATQPIP